MIEGCTPRTFADLNDGVVFTCRMNKIHNCIEFVPCKSYEDGKREAVEEIIKEYGHFMDAGCGCCAYYEDDLKDLLANTPTNDA